ncbi:type II toxin-antitoxin system VapC family toxin [Archaeoglobus sp.]
MKDKVVLDSSIIVALFFKEELSDEVEKIVEEYSEYYTVDISYSEVANAAWKKVRIYGEDEELSKRALDVAVDFIEKVCRVEDSRVLLNQAFELAVKHNLTVYDALFIVLAMKLNEKLLTTDRKLYSKIEGTNLGKFVECL